MTVPEFGHAPNSTTVQVTCRECGEMRAVIFAIDVASEVSRLVLKAGFDRVADWLLAHYGRGPQLSSEDAHVLVEMGLADPGAVPACPRRRLVEPQVKEAN